MKIKTKEGYIKTKRGKVYYKKLGDKGIPLIILHGGPGGPHNYLEPLKDIASKRTMIFYDQIGCGKSDRLPNKKDWQVKTFVEELKEIIKKLNLKEYHLLGHSWGAALAVSFISTTPNGLRAIILADPYLSTPIWIKDAKKLIKKLSKKMQKAINKGETDSPEYKSASDEYYKRFVRRMNPVPRAFKKPSKGFGKEIYQGMWGPKEFSVRGTLKEYDASKKLKSIRSPVLLVCGKYDEATPGALKIFHKLIPGAKIKIFQKSAHLPFWTERKEFMKVVQDFLKGVE